MPPSVSGLCRRTLLVEIDQGFALAAGLGEKLIKRGLAFREDPVTPALCRRKVLLIHPVITAEPIQRFLYGRCIHLPHDLADKLLLPPERAMGLDALGFDNLFLQVLVGVDAANLLLTQRDQLFAKFLQRQVLALFLTLAGLTVIHRLSYAAVRDAVGSTMVALREV